jgi:putative membrane-bound dehydrogenase-like protein
MHPRGIIRRCLALFVIFGAAWILFFVARPAQTEEKPPATTDKALPFRVPTGFVAECIAGPPLVEHPMFACFDEQGRLFVADSLGVNPAGEQLRDKPAQVIRVLEDADGDGRYDKSTIFADKLTYPEGIAWHEGAIYTAAPPSVWRLEDNGKGIAGERRELVTGFVHTGVADELHGPTLGRDGRLYFGCGRFAHEIRNPGGPVRWKGRAPLILRCRPDGRDLEVFSGAHGNPVKAAFTPEGEVLYCGTWGTRLETMGKEGRPREDSLLHCIAGGNYPHLDGDFFSPEFAHTPELLPPLAYLGVAAACGMARYEGDAFGADYRGNLFSALYNMHQVRRHVIERDGATFRARPENFLVSEDAAFHPTDVVEDADGSLLVVDTGSWFSHCPTSQLGKKPVAGGIYRIRRQGAARLADPRGLSLKWDRLTARELTTLLDDPRFAVRERAIACLAKQGNEAVVSLQEVIRTGRTAAARRNAIWALTRIDGAEARAAVRLAPADKDASVRQTAAYAAGLHRDTEALPRLLEILASDAPPLRRAAADALGRLGQGRAVTPLLERLKQSEDIFLEHSLLYALIRIGDRAATVKGLDDPDPRVRRGALIALDQMDHGNLTREQVTPLLSTVDPALRQTALAVIIARPGWASEILRPLKEWLDAKTLSAEQQAGLRGAVLAFAKDPAVQQQVADALEQPSTPDATRLLLLETLAQAPLDKFPPLWSKGLQRSLEQSHKRIVRQALAAVQAGGVSDLDDSLLRLARDNKESDEVRLEALAVVAARLPRIEPELFAFLRTQLDKEQEPLRRRTAASVLGSARLERRQLETLCQAIQTASPLELRQMLAAYEHPGDAALGAKLLAALEKSPALSSLPAGLLRRVLKEYPTAVRQAAEPLYQRLQGNSAQQRARLAELEPVLSGGDVQHGREVFFGKKAACTACHAIQGQGGRIGPDLSKIGSIRTRHDLLEAVVFPSASFARGYEPYQITLRSGRVSTGLIARETADALYLVAPDRAEIRVPRSAIETLERSTVSIMPQGLDGQMSQQELTDLLAFLSSLR